MSQYIIYFVICHYYLLLKWLSIYSSHSNPAAAATQYYAFNYCNKVIILDMYYTI